MTLPIRQLNTITSEIAGGAYNKRVHFRRKDELGELGCTFDKMADSVEEKIQQMTREVENKQQFIENWAHEMKTPLTAILGYTAFLRDAKCSEQERLIATGHLYDAARRLQELSGKLMDITLLEHDSLILAPVNLSPLMQSLHTLMDEKLKQRGLTLETDLRIETINADEALLLSLLINLVENAARLPSQAVLLLSALTATPMLPSSWRIRAAVWHRRISPRSPNRFTAWISPVPAPMAARALACTSSRESFSCTVHPSKSVHSFIEERRFMSFLQLHNNLVATSQYPERIVLSAGQPVREHLRGLRLSFSTRHIPGTQRPTIAKG